MKPVMQAVEKLYLKEDVPKFDVGDKVEVHMRIVEGEKERIQVIEGIVIRKTTCVWLQTIVRFVTHYQIS